MLVIKRQSNEEKIEQLKRISEREYRRVSSSDNDFITRFKLFACLEIWNIVENARLRRGFAAAENVMLDEYMEAINACYSAVVHSDLRVKDTVLRGLIAALEIGSRTRPNADQVETEMRRRQSRIANSAKSEKRETLKRAILACAQEGNLTLAASEKFARAIRGDVCARLGVKENEHGWPSFSVIKNAVSDIKKG